MDPSALHVLQRHYAELADIHLSTLFNEDSLRFERFSLKAAGLFLDYSKNCITEQSLQHLIQFALTRELPAQIEALFSGQIVNATEARPALHTALRDPSGQPIVVNGKNIVPEINHSLSLMEKIVGLLTTGSWLGYNQLPITDVVHIGIGGSHLGPLLVCEALNSYPKTPLNCHFVASVDACELDGVLRHLDPRTTLFILASKTFTTQETLATADRAKAWLLNNISDIDISRHFLATTAQVDNALSYGIAADCILPFWEWVGGRYSVWSTIGLPIALQYGMATFKELLAGAYDMDMHFRHTPYTTNMPVILGLLGFWYGTFFNATAQAILPYDFNLRSLPRYLQQLDMESNGKRVQKNGQPVEFPTAPVIFGEIGTNGQHSFHQLLFQGTHFIPSDFIATLASSNTQSDHAILLSHCFAQSRALMLGKSADIAQAELIQQGYDLQTATQLALHKAIPGNCPSNTLLIEKLTPHTLGALMALYEHKIFVQGVLWNINSFDQWGVELGKGIAKDILATLQQQKVNSNYDASTTGLVNYVQHQSRDDV